MSEKNSVSASKQLRLIIKNEYLTDIRGKGFWIATFGFPLVMIIFSGFFAFLAEDSDALQTINNPTGTDMENLSPAALLAMLVGICLTMFIMVYGAQIFNKVKAEKCNRIVEILATCIDGRTMMLAKIISVALVGLTQLLLWGILIFAFASIFIAILLPSISLDILANPAIWKALAISLLYFVGGYLLYGSLYAATGALTDKNNENQEYMTILTFILLGAFYLGQFAVDNSQSALAKWCDFIPFTSPTVGSINAVSGDMNAWQIILSLVVLYASAAISIIFSGKIYRSSILLNGKKFSPKDIITFLKSK